MANPINRYSREEYFSNPEISPLKAAYEAGDFQLVKSLILNGADVNAVSGWDRSTILHKLCFDIDNPELHYELIQLLLEHGADVSIRNYRGHTALHLAAIRKDFKLIALLLNQGADPNSENDFYETPLYIFLQGVYSSEGTAEVQEVFELFLSKGADINLVHGDGYTLLMKSCIYRRKWAFKILSQHNANPHLEDRKHGHTALDMLLNLSPSEPDMVKDLLKTGASVNRIVNQSVINEAHRMIRREFSLRALRNRGCGWKWPKPKTELAGPTPKRYRQAY